MPSLSLCPEGLTLYLPCSFTPWWVQSLPQGLSRVSPLVSERVKEGGGEGCPSLVDAAESPGEGQGSPGPLPAPYMGWAWAKQAALVGGLFFLSDQGGHSPEEGAL